VADTVLGVQDGPCRHERLLEDDRKEAPGAAHQLLNPRYIKTDMSVYSGTLSPAEGASNLLKVLLLPEGGPTGKYFDEGTVAPFV
jgi:(+)-neomenthol dehydrogenase